MDSLETFRNTVNTTTSTSTATATSLSEFPPVQESTFFRSVNNLSPIIPAKASHLARGFLGLNSPPLVFTSPHISSQCETHFLKRPQLSQFEISQWDTGGNGFIDDPDNSKKSAFLPPVKVITDAQKDLLIKNGGNMQHRSSSPCVNEYLVDHVDVVKQSNEIVESSQSDVPCSKEIISKFHGHSDNYEGVDEPYKLEGEKTDVGSLSKECGKSEKQQCDNSFVQAGLRHRGMHRRCLQYEVAASNAFGNINSSPLPVHTLEDSKAWAAFSELKDLDVTSIKKKMVQCPELVNSLIPPQFSGNFPVTGSKPSGIGLHLNSTVDAMPLGHAAFTHRQDMKSASSICHNVENMYRCLISSNMDGQSSVGIEDERREITASIVSVSATPESASTMDPSNLLDYVEHTAGIQNKRKLSPKEAGNAEEINQPSPKNKKTKISVTSDGAGCKRCNCKKSKCLKLYCDCFAAGMYCDETCSCQDCYNRLEYEDTVLETKQQIESRNPLAFIPKIVQRATDFPLNNMEVDNVSTPSSARHKRGCNCKRSMCLKKYCECYQVNVGCSSACRCEGCKNTFGKKEDYIATEHALSKGLSGRVEKISHSTFHNKQEMVANKTDLLRGELFDMHRLSPLTPSLQCSDQGKEAAKSRVLTGKYLPSPECDATAFPPRAKFAHSLENPERSLVLLETNETVETEYCDWQLDRDNMEIMDQPPLRCTSVNNAGQFTPLSNASSMARTATFLSLRQWAHLPQEVQQFHGNSSLLSGGSHHWRSSPITPTAKLNEINNVVCPESASRLFDILEDETPEILKEASIPIKSVKSSSPNQKRVSPPESHARELESGGLRNGRKFIINAMPSFPPLTPCIDSKGTSHENLDTGTGK
ncbi:hypothetical protein L6164_024295 [Bauhinia variegata]|uniref:Uncharacterized protein n=1 Tax=Bauhinia variegata TaxID=167791 RepID=A0ACB9LX15_BAUVA|nr:hypothetical protein L6164_024295 [Bauhinia variegata]